MCITDPSGNIVNLRVKRVKGKACATTTDISRTTTKNLRANAMAQINALVSPEAVFKISLLKLLASEASPHCGIRWKSCISAYSICSVSHIPGGSMLVFPLIICVAFFYKW